MDHSDDNFSLAGPIQERCEIIPLNFMVKQITFQAFMECAYQLGDQNKVEISDFTDNVFKIDLLSASTIISGNAVNGSNLFASSTSVLAKVFDISFTFLAYF